MSDAESREFFACFQVLAGWRHYDLYQDKMASIEWSERIENGPFESPDAMLWNDRMRSSKTARFDVQLSYMIP
jgi:hypothetical protein